MKRKIKYCIYLEDGEKKINTNKLVRLVAKEYNGDNHLVSGKKIKDIYANKTLETFEMNLKSLNEKTENLFANDIKQKQVNQNLIF
jgi:hypothetical protein